MEQSYEEFRLAQIAANRAKLLELGLTPLKKYSIAVTPVHAFPTPSPSPGPKAVKVKVKLEDHPRVEGSRSSSRVKNIALASVGAKTEDVGAMTLSDDEFDERRMMREEREGELAWRLDRSAARPNPKRFGSIPGTRVGQWEPGRMAFSQRGIHAPVVAGISGHSQLGCWSVSLAGGYPEDVDLGYSFSYTGSGGRDLKGTKANPKNLRTAPQTSDQTFTALNLALQRSSETAKPVRVIRGFKCKSPFAPLTGYRYDGLYHVKKAWMDVGSTGFKVCRYAFARLPGQPPLSIQPGRHEEAAMLVEDIDPEQAALIRANAGKKPAELEGQDDEMEELSEEDEDEQVAAELVPAETTTAQSTPPTPASSDTGSTATPSRLTRKRKVAELAQAREQARTKAAKVAKVVKEKTAAAAKPAKAVVEGARRSSRFKGITIE